MAFSRATIAKLSQFFDSANQPSTIYLVFDVFDSEIATQSWRAEYRIVGAELAALPADEPARTAGIRMIVAREARIAYDAWMNQWRVAHPSVITHTPEQLRALAPILPSEAE